MNAEEFLVSVRAVVEHSEHFREDGFEVKQYQGFRTVHFCRTAVIRVVELKKGPRLELADRYFGRSEVAGLDSYRKPINGWARIELSDASAEAILRGAQNVYEQCYLDEPVEHFGCCSRYGQCSDEKKCVQPDRDLARGCSYKRNLENGRIFYGKNRNED
jgi:hypothetical protein